jgi:hypothetical protein
MLKNRRVRCGLIMAAVFILIAFSISSEALPPKDTSNNTFNVTATMINRTTGSAVKLWIATVSVRALTKDGGQYDKVDLGVYGTRGNGQPDSQTKALREGPKKQWKVTIWKNDGSGNKKDYENTYSKKPKTITLKATDYHYYDIKFY